MSPILSELLGLTATPAPPELGPGPREGVLSVSDIDRRLNPLLEKNGLSRSAQQLIRATIYLWHDHLDDSHSIAQGIENTDGSLVHGIMHRREPDYGNARYWFKRVGAHPSFDALAERVGGVSSAALQKKLLRSGKWHPYAFIDECERAANNRSEATPLREVQAVESKVLLEYFLGQE